MTVTDTEIADKTEKIQAPEKTKLFNLPQIAGGALAAVTTAALASRLGVAGTLAGAAGASVIAAVASTLYTRGLEQTRDGVKKIVLRDANGSTEVITVVEDESPEASAGSASSAVPARSRSKWTHPVTLVAGTLVTAAVTFVVAMGLITGWEFTNGGTLSGKDGTTIGQAGNRASTKPTPSPSVTPSETPSTTPSETPSPVGTPSATPTPSATTPTPSLPSTPSVTATDAVTEGAAVAG